MALLLMGAAITSRREARGVAPLTPQIYAVDELDRLDPLGQRVAVVFNRFRVVFRLEDSTHIGVEFFDQMGYGDQAMVFVERGGNRVKVTQLERNTWYSEVVSAKSPGLRVVVTKNFERAECQAKIVPQQTQNGFPTVGVSCSKVVKVPHRKVKLSRRLSLESAVCFMYSRDKQS